MLSVDHHAFDSIFDEPVPNENSELVYNLGGNEDSKITLVIQTPEELEAYTNEPMIEEEWEWLDNNHDGRRNENLEVTEDFTDEFQEVSAVTAASRSFTQVRDTAKSQRTATEVPGLDSTQMAKTEVRIPEVQKERLVQLVQNNFLKAVGQVAGANGKFIKANLWKTFATELNTLGPPRTADQWKTTFNNIKAGAKAKIADDHNEGTKSKNLTRLEEKIVSIYRMDNMDGHQSLGESGFSYSKTVPQPHSPFAELCSTRSDANSQEDDLDEPIEDANAGSGSRPYSRHSLMFAETIDTGSRKVGVTSSAERDFNSRTEGSFSSRTERVLTSRAEGAFNSRPEETVPDMGSANRAKSSRRCLEDDVLREIIDEIRNEPDEMDKSLRRSEINVLRPLSRASSTSNGTENRGAYIRLQSDVASPTEGTFTSRKERVFTSRVEGVSTTRPGVGSRPGGIIIPTTRPQSSRSMFAPPRVRRTMRSQSPTSDHIEYVTDINQFFNDRGDDDESATQHSSGRRSIRNGDQNVGTVGTKTRDRSNLRNKHASYEMVQHSISSQERFIEDSNRNHSETMFLHDRNHLEMIGIYNSTLKSLVDVAREFVNKK